MCQPINPHEAQASELLSVCCEQDNYSRLRAYAGKLAGDDADELLQQGLLDAHDAVQARGTTSPASQYPYLVMTIMKRRFVDGQRRAGRVVDLMLTDEKGLVNEHAGAVAVGRRQLREAHEAERAQQLGHLAAAELAGAFPMADRVCFRLSAEGYSSRKIAELTGRNYMMVHRRVNQIQKHLQQFLTPLLATV